MLCEFGEFFFRRGYIYVVSVFVNFLAKECAHTRHSRSGHENTMNGRIFEKV